MKTIELTVKHKLNINAEILKEFCRSLLLQNLEPTEEMLVQDLTDFVNTKWSPLGRDGMTPELYEGLSVLNSEELMGDVVFTYLQVKDQMFSDRTAKIEAVEKELALLKSEL